MTKIKSDYPVGRAQVTFTCDEEGYFTLLFKGRKPVIVPFAQKGLDILKELGAADLLTFNQLQVFTCFVLKKIELISKGLSPFWSCSSASSAHIRKVFRTDELIAIGIKNEQKVTVHYTP